MGYGDCEAERRSRQRCVKVVSPLESHATVVIVVQLHGDPLHATSLVIDQRRSQLQYLRTWVPAEEVTDDKAVKLMKFLADCYLGPRPSSSISTSVRSTLL